MRHEENYTSNTVSKEDRELVSIDKEQTLVERGGLYFVRSYSYIGQVRLATYTGLDELDTYSQEIRDIVERGD